MPAEARFHKTASDRMSVGDRPASIDSPVPHLDGLPSPHKLATKTLSQTQRGPHLPEQQIIEQFGYGRNAASRVLTLFDKETLVFLPSAFCLLPSAFFTKSIANAANAFNPTRTTDGINLFTNSLHTDIYHVGIGIEIIAPDVFQNLRSGEDSSRR